MNEPISDDVLRKALELAEKATDGEWETGGPYPSVSVIVCTDPGSAFSPYPEPPEYEPICRLHQAGMDGDYTTPPPQQAVDDATFIVHAGTHYAEVCRELLALRAERDRMLALVAEYAADVLRSLGHLCKGGQYDGWWDTCALTTAMEAGDRLVEMGLWERHEDGFGRRWFYRPLAAKEESP